MSRATGRLVRVVLLSFAALVVFATPASAHGIGGTAPTNYETALTRITPTTPGVQVSVIDLGNQLRLVNDTDRDVIVLGYEGEDYLRVGPRGVFENQRSPATFLNRSRTPTRSAPTSADPEAAPEWRKVSDGRVARWHDHRAHFMGTHAPPVVQRDPDREHVLDRWTVPLRDGDRSVEVHGTLTWIPPPSPWPSVVIVVALAAAVIALGRTRLWRRVLVIGTGALVVCAVAHAVGNWGGADSASFGTKLGESVYSIVGVGLALLALGWMWRRGVDAAVPFVLVASVFLLVAGGLADISTLGHSQVPSSLAPVLARVTVACTIGLGIGLATTAALRLRVIAPPPSGRPAVTS
jgi:hypothetical protein